jgi:hypothetical protein
MHAERDIRNQPESILESETVTHLVDRATFLDFHHSDKQVHRDYSLFSPTGDIAPLDIFSNPLIRPRPGSKVRIDGYSRSIPAPSIDKCLLPAYVLDARGQ